MDIEAGIAELYGSCTAAAGASPSLAVPTMQAAGAKAIATLGPALDALSGSDPYVMGLTQQAWKLNETLARIHAGEDSTQGDSDAAYKVVRGMVDLYQRAYHFASHARSTSLRAGFGADVASGIIALQQAVAQYGGPGIDNPSGAVQGLQAAGNIAVSTVGPAIDTLSGGAPDVMKVTQFAWQANAKLAGVRSGPDATQDDVKAAKAIVLDMISQYQQAQRLAASKHFVPKAAPAPVVPSGGQPMSAPAPSPAPLVVTPSPWASILLPTAAGGAIGYFGLAAVRAALGPVGLVVGAIAGMLIGKKLAEPKAQMAGEAGDDLMRFLHTYGPPARPAQPVADFQAASGLPVNGLYTKQVQIALAMSLDPTHAVTVPEPVI
jgi:hypothetical protein